MTLSNLGYQAKHVVSDDEEVEEELEQLRVKWKARMPVEDEEKETVNPLKINWTARVPDEGNEKIALSILLFSLLSSNNETLA